MPGVITNSESPTAADHDRITATRETLEDYTLRLAPRSYRRWPPAVVGISALGGIAYLADFAIGANVGITWGTANALCGIAIFRTGGLRHRLAAGLLRGAVQHRPGSDYPR